MKLVYKKGYNEFYIKKYEEFEKRIPKEYPNKNFFTLEEIDIIFKKYNFKKEKMDPYDWVFAKGETKVKMDPDELDSNGLTEGYNPPGLDFYAYKQEGSIKKGRDAGFIILADKNGNFFNSFFSQNNICPAEVLLNYLETLSKEGTK